LEAGVGDHWPLDRFQDFQAANIAAGHGFKYTVLPLAANATASKPTDSSKSGSKRGPGDKSDKYKSNRAKWEVPRNRPPTKNNLYISI
jgi:hypothetical protein